MFDENPFDYGAYPKAEFGEVLPEFEEIAINRNSSESLGLSDSRSVNASLMLNRRLEKPGAMLPSVEMCRTAKARAIRTR